MKFLPLIIMAFVAGSCANGSFGNKVKEPFQCNAYESNASFFRGVGKGESSADNVAFSKADLDAKTQLASQMNTTIKQVADQYLGQTQSGKAADVDDKFESLVREVMSTSIADLRKIGQQKYFDDKQDKYTVFVAYEIKKNAMFRFLKKQALTDRTISDEQQKAIQKILDEEIEKAEKDEK
jgi:hypothetical protein